jgi:hypothetical protein
MKAKDFQSLESEVALLSQKSTKSTKTTNKIKTSCKISCKINKYPNPHKNNRNFLHQSNKNC